MILRVYGFDGWKKRCFEDRPQNLRRRLRHFHRRQSSQKIRQRVEQRAENFAGRLFEVSMRQMPRMSSRILLALMGIGIVEEEVKTKRTHQMTIILADWKRRDRSSLLCFSIFSLASGRSKKFNENLNESIVPKILCFSPH